MVHKRLNWILTALTCLCLVFWGSSALAKAKPRRYTRAQIKQALAKAKVAHIHKALRTSQALQALHHKQIALQHRLERGMCRSANYPWIGKSCSTHCVLRAPTFKRRCHKVVVRTICIKFPSGTRCVKRAKICLPVKRTRRVQLCLREYRGAPMLTINGRRSGLNAVAHLVQHELAVLRRDFNRVKNEARQVGHRIQATANTVAHAASHVFDSVLTKVRREAKKIAHRLAPVFKNRVNQKLASVWASKTFKASQLFWKKSQKPLLEALEMDDYNQVQKVMEERRSSSQMMRDFTETVLLSIGLTLAADTLMVTLKCWPYSKGEKRACLKDAVAIEMRDTIFNLTGTIVQTALDVSVIEPASGELAAEVAAGLAAVTEGVGAIAFPIAYEASSIAMNMLTFVLWEQLRTPYNKLYAEKLAKPNQKWIDRMVDRLPASLMKCHGPHFLCKSRYTPQKTASLR